MGFVLQLCALRCPGRLLTPGAVIPEAISRFIGAQQGIAGDALLAYAERRQTRQQHLEALRAIYGSRPFYDRKRRKGKHHTQALIALTPAGGL